MPANLTKILILGVVLFTTTLQAQKTFPDITVKSLEGKDINLKEYIADGQPTLINVWATWCKPCHKEMDAFSEVYEDWQADYSVRIVSVSIDTQRALSKVKPMVNANNWPFDIFTDPKQEIQTKLNFRAIPQTFIVDKNGSIVYSHSGYAPGIEYEIEEVLEQL